MKTMLEDLKAASDALTSAPPADLEEAINAPKVAVAFGALAADLANVSGKKASLPEVKTVLIKAITAVAGDAKSNLVTAAVKAYRDGIGEKGMAEE